MHCENNRSVEVFVREGIEKYVIDKAEHYSGRANPKSQRKDSNHSEAPVSAQTPKRVSKIPPKVIEPCLPTRIANFFLHTINSAKFQPRPPPSFFRRQASLHVIIHLPFEMKLQFFIELVFAPRFVDQPMQPPHHFAPDSAARSIRATASDSRSHFRTSVSNCSRPFFVSE